MSTPLLELKNIKKDFFGNQVLTDINLTLNEGEVPSFETLRSQSFWGMGETLL